MDTQLDKLQQMVEQIQFTQVQMQVVEGLKQANECLEQMHKASDLDLGTWHKALIKILYFAC